METISEEEGGASERRWGRDAVLDVARDLHASADELDVDNVDGEFYWRCCRPELFADATAIREKLEDRNVMEGSQEAALATVQAWDAFVDRYQRDYPNLLDYLFAGKWLRMRDAHSFLWSHLATGPFEGRPGQDGETTATIRVFSSGWSGQDVEIRLRTFLEKVGDQAIPGGLAPRPPWPTDATAVRVALRYLEQEDTSGQSALEGRSPFTAPHIAISVGLPLPAKGTLAHLYDTIARNERRWHERLPSANGQAVRVAIRTWAVALLAITEMSTTGAIVTVAELQGLGDGDDDFPISRARFDKDRALLLKRVPEAREYLFRAKKRG